MLHIYVISLERDTEKRIAIEKTLKGFNLDFSFIDAIDGITLPESQINLIRQRSVGAVARRGFPAAAGEIGCTLSHVKTYQKILEDNRDWACILEDDVILDERFKVFIDIFQSNEMNPKDLYVLGGMNEISTVMVRSIKNNKYIGKQKFDKLIKSEHFVYRSCCYVISSAMGNELSVFYEGNFIVADDWCYLSKNEYINRIYLSDFVEHPTELSASTIEKGRKEGEINKKFRKVSFSWRVKNSLKQHIRFRVLTLYKYIEKKDTV